MEDVAFRVVAGNVAPDRSAIAEFRVRHERSLADLFSGVLGLCARAGLASVGVVAIDGTKIAANASMDANRDFGQIARGILAEAAEIDRREALYGSERGDELPAHLRTREGRRKALREAKERLARERDLAAEPPADEDARIELELDPQQFVTRPMGRRAWVRPRTGGPARARRPTDRQRPRRPALRGLPASGGRARRRAGLARRL